MIARKAAGLLALLSLAACADYGGDMGEPVPVPPPPPPAAEVLGPSQTYRVIAGDTVDTVAQQFGVPVEQLIAVNHLAYPYVLRKGQALAIPGRGAALAAAPGDHVVAAGETLSRIAQRNGTTVAALAALNGLAPPYTIRIGQHLRLPAPAPTEVASASATDAVVQMPASTPWPTLPAAASSKMTTEALPPPPGVAAAPGPAAAATTAAAGTAGASALPPPVLQPVAPAAPPPGDEPIDAAQAAPKQAASPPPVPKPDQPKPSAPGSAPSASGVAENMASLEPPPSAPSEAVQPAPRGAGKFLWPVNGKVVSPFGVKEGGQHNDGINIAAPLGTPVRAADNGVVVYAGNELRGFGNLLLIRHADGWVSAYAHCDALLVKRGEQVKRGQVVARVGQTGAVATPQLHFELRKSGQAVDPSSELGPQGA